MQLVTENVVLASTPFVDKELSTTSENPISNKAVTKPINKIQKALTVTDNDSLTVTLEGDSITIEADEDISIAGDICTVESTAGQLSLKSYDGDLTLYTDDNEISLTADSSNGYVSIYANNSEDSAIFGDEKGIALTSTSGNGITIESDSDIKITTEKKCTY